MNRKRRKAKFGVLLLNSLQVDQKYNEEAGIALEILLQVVDVLYNCYFGFSHRIENGGRLEVQLFADSIYVSVQIGAKQRGCTDFLPDTHLS
mmetsp:Transcript_23967/g.18294  ORF Transcript_23967/g.18294 Transcript_23967/m.18294 type:complete len:92 (+) Transcript_23967:990-1265(+)